MPGTIIIKPIEANLLHEHELAHKMNPYCTLKLGDVEFEGSSCSNGGLHPCWSDMIKFPVEKDVICDGQIKDKTDSIEKFAGSFHINLEEIRKEGVLRKWYPIAYEGESVGDILIEGTFIEGDNPLARNESKEGVETK